MERYLITGANRGLGLEMTRQLLGQGKDVTATARNLKSASELDALKSEHPSLKLLELDVAKAETVSALRDSVSELDVLINNAGMINDYGAPFVELDTKSLAEIVDVNVFGAIRVTQALLPALQKSSQPKVASLTSKMGSIADNSSGGAYGYRLSKAALNMLNKTFSIEFPKITAIVLHPGWVQTDMGGSSAPTTPQESASGLIKVIQSSSLEDTGKFIDFRGQEIPW